MKRSNESPASDLRAVAWTADLLDLSEYGVFEIAYQQWFRQPAEQGLIDRYFTPYMYDGVAPFWVRDFTRRTLAGARFAVECSGDIPGAGWLRLALDLCAPWRRGFSPGTGLRA